MRALIIDDNQSVRTFVARVLMDAGFEITLARDGIQAQQLVLKDGPPDLVITDESMPRMSGHEFAQWVRASFPGVKVLFFSGYADALRRAETGHGDGDVGYLEKPCGMGKLLHAVMSLTGPGINASYGAQSVL